MCGFVGRVGQETSRRSLNCGLRWLRRRGPDSRRLWRSADGRVEVLHARLAIVDKDSRAHQPFAHPSAPVVVAFAGEIYNYERLRLQLADHNFETLSDTEVILACYLRHGLPGLKLLKGMYSVCIVDERSREVVLARDPVGKKPLFIANWGGEAYFGTTTTAMLAVSGQTALVKEDEETLAHYWKHSYIRPDRSALNDAIPVRPGAVIVLNWDGHLKTETDCLPEPIAVYAGEPWHEAAQKMLELVEGSVGRRLYNNPNPTTVLSGGIDSTLVTAVAGKICAARGLPLNVLTLSSLVPFSNDEPYARYAAHRLGLSLQLVNPSFGRIQDSILRAMDLQDDPLGMPSFFALERLVAAASAHSRILLTGDGGDEIFLGYGEPEDWVHKSESDNYLPIRAGDLPGGMGSWGRKMAFDSLVGHMHTKADRASAEQGVELRCPLLDYDLVNYARSLPLNFLAHDGRPKALLKALLGNWPRWFVDRRKMGFPYNLRWIWMVSNFDGLRESIHDESLEAFSQYLPASLRKPPLQWKRSAVWRDFDSAWRLLAWSRFLNRVRAAEEQSSFEDVEPLSICLIGGAHPSHNPRLIREADLLTAKGHRVRVVAPSYLTYMLEKDRRLMKYRAWLLQKNNACSTSILGSVRSLWARTVRRFSRTLFPVFKFDSMAKRAALLDYSRILRIAESERADWFIAHTQVALPAAASAAQLWKARFGFDCEDLLAETGIDSPELILQLEKTYLPQCDYVSVPSQRMADSLKASYNLRKVQVLYNVFPLSLARGICPPQDRKRNEKLRLYWFGQVMGTGRGLENAIEALAALREHVELHFRGHFASGFDEELRRLSANWGVSLFFHDQVDHDDTIRVMEPCDVGLALEQNSNSNYSKTISNKVFSYLLAGLPVLATDTPGQREALSVIPDAGFIFSKSDEMVEILQKWIYDREALEAAKRAAWSAARHRYCWDKCESAFMGLILPGEASISLDLACNE